MWARMRDTGWQDLKLQVNREERGWSRNTVPVQAGCLPHLQGQSRRLTGEKTGPTTWAGKGKWCPREVRFSLNQDLKGIRRNSGEVELIGTVPCMSEQTDSNVAPQDLASRNTCPVWSLSLGWGWDWWFASNRVRQRWQDACVQITTRDRKRRSLDLAILLVL